MKLRIIVFILLLPALAFSQIEMTSGKYGALNLAFDKDAKVVTAYYENSSGWDEESQRPRFSCAFYFYGKVSEHKIKIASLSPIYAEDRNIEGILEILDTKHLKIQLEKEHGGCWNVEHFVDKPVDFSLYEEENQMQLRYVTAGKAYFYAGNNEESKETSYVLKGDILCVEKIENKWAYCNFIDRPEMKGWIKITDLNVLW